MTSLRTKFDNIEKLHPQARGKGFEQLLGQMLEDANLKHVLSYRPEGEEIDGAFWWLNRVVLLEAKWVKDPMPASSIYAFKGKVAGKFKNTIGIFVSMSGYSKDCVDALVHGKELDILLFDKDDVLAVIDGTPFLEVLEEKLFAAGRTGEVYITWPNLQNVASMVSATKMVANARVAGGTTGFVSAPVFICEGRSDKVILQHLVAHVAASVQAPMSPQFLVAQGKRDLMGRLIPALASLLASGIGGNSSVVLVFDSDTQDCTAVERQRMEVKKALKDLPAGWQAHVAIAAPEIESWLGTEGRLRGPALPKALANTDWGAVEKVNPEVAALCEFLRRSS